MQQVLKKFLAQFYKKNQKKFIGLKKDDHLILNVVSVFENKTDLAAMLNISAEELTGLVWLGELKAYCKFRRLWPGAGPVATWRAGNT